MKHISKIRRKNTKNVYIMSLFVVRNSVAVVFDRKNSHEFI